MSRAYVLQRQCEAEARRTGSFPPTGPLNVRILHALRRRPRTGPSWCRNGQSSRRGPLPDGRHFGRVHERSRTLVPFCLGCGRPCPCQDSFRTAAGKDSPRYLCENTAKPTCGRLTQEARNRSAFDMSPSRPGVNTWHFQQASPSATSTWARMEKQGPQHLQPPPAISSADPDTATDWTH